MANLDFHDEMAGLRGYQLPKPVGVVSKLAKMTTTERNALITNSIALEGDVVFDTDTKKAYCYNGTSWQAFW